MLVTSALQLEYVIRLLNVLNFFKIFLMHVTTTTVP